MAERSWLVLGGLGPGLHAPVLAEQHGAGGVRRVVLARPTPPAAVAAAASPSFRVVGEWDRVVLDGQELGVYRWAGGHDVATLLARHPDGLSPVALRELADGALEALDRAGCSHGALDAGALRVGPDGVCLVGFRGKESDDRQDLAHLLEDWGEAPQALLDAVAQGDREALAALSLSGPTLAELAAGLPEPPLFEHRWTGQTLTEKAASSGPPPKVRTAAIAGLTLLLGGYAAWFYLGGGA